MEVFLRELLPRVIGDRATFSLYPSQGKMDLLRNLPARLRGYAKWLPANWRIVVVVDRDGEDCYALKETMEQFARQAGLRTRAGTASSTWQVLNRIAIEELEAWYFGDLAAVRQAYPKVPKTVAEKATYRDPDSVEGGTWEAFERLLQKAGYFQSGLRKTEAANAIGKLIDPARNSSHSFRVFCEAVFEAVD